MFRNFFKVAIRNLVRHKGFSFINIAGLTLGLTACILIGLFVWDEQQFDRFLPGGENVYRVYSKYLNNGEAEERAVAPPMFATTLKQDFPEVEQTTRIMMLSESKRLFEVGSTKLYEQEGYFVDSTFFEVFPLTFVYGTPSKALDESTFIVLSEEMSARYFGQTDPVGKQIIMNKVPLVVKGVFRKNPKFHLQFDYLRSISSVGLPAQRMLSWTWNQFFNYCKVKKGTDVAALEKKFQSAVKTKSAPFVRQSNSGNIPFLQPLKDIHLFSANFKFDIAKRGNSTYVNALTLIAVFILLIACFNFVNLSTAKSAQRAKEVGVRKAVGAGRTQLMFQFIGETVLFSLISILLSFLLAASLLPWLNQFTEKQISYNIFKDPIVILLVIALSLAVGMLAGFYPAIVLSNFKPVKVLKGATGDEEPGKVPWLRHGLVVIQFSLSALLIISAIVVFNQVNYLHTKDLGFRKDQIMFFQMRGDTMFNKAEAFKQQLEQAAGVNSVSIGYGFPGDAVAGDQIITNTNGQKTNHSATQLAADYDYVKTLGLKIVAGRDFSRSMGTDKDHAWIINETAVTQLGFGSPEKALGKTLSWPVWGASNPDSLKVGQVIGVVRDFNYKSLYDKVESAVIQIFPGAAFKVAVKINGANINNTVNEINGVWKRFSPDYPLEYKFLDENFEQMYRSEDKLKTLLWIFTGIAIVVGCLGLFGLAAYTAERRKKEVGIRKVLGASTQSVTMLLSRDFIKLVIISLVIASPIAWYFMNEWLQDFAYRVSISWWIFLLAAVITLSIAFVTVSFQAIRAAIANPVKSLRTE